MQTEDPAARTVDVWVAMNENGDYQVGTDPHDALERLTGEHEGSLYRSVRLQVTMSPPPIIDVEVAIPDEPPGDVAVVPRGDRHCDRRIRNRSPRVTG